MLAVRVIADQGIAVHALNIDVGFGGDPEKTALMRSRAEAAGASFEVVDVRSRYLREVLFHPKYGYGKHFNPCIDCHGFMFKTALSMLDEFGASFVISGEVVGQRPMSQRRDAMSQVRKLSGDEEDLVLRPLCAKLLPPTRPEREGWVNREMLLDISGRGRTRQIELAAKYGFSDYETPAGGCLFTRESFAGRIRDFLAHEGEDMSEQDLQTLRWGRHLRLPNGAKLVIGRDESENEKLSNLNNPRFIEIEPLNLTGAFVLISASASEDDLALAARLALTYQKCESGKEYEVRAGGRVFLASPFPDKAAAKPYFVS